MSAREKPMPPTHLHRPRQNAPSARQTIKRAQACSAGYRKKPVTLPKMPKFDREK